MTQTNTHQADDLTRARALVGPHRGWDTYDIGNEGARIHLIHEAVMTVPFPRDHADALLTELEAFADSAGYADADSCLHAISAGKDETLNAFMRASVFEEHGENDYFAEVRKSERALYAAARTPEAREFLGEHGRMAWDGAYGTLSRKMLAAYEHGRDLKASEESMPTSSLSLSP
ncbi:hypothetical protein GOB57_24095 [Sinorhizobium meliloti]|nr:hypothetical protein [Sinorhizobium meliloti]